ncbi:hypothetical protein [Emticicia agri]|uniref:hypothetical protein n=1 Tax=Emticicia agri TaxID=2492393 RepID=UPI0013ED5A91|nr:hypothetical protein [Emticicia agri]
MATLQGKKKEGARNSASQSSDAANSVAKGTNQNNSGSDSRPQITGASPKK